MNRGFYSKLAYSAIKKNYRLYISYILVAQIDFSVFYVLAVLPHKAHGSVVLLLPKEKTVHSYCGMYIGQKCHWYGTVEQMPDSAVQRNYIVGIQKAILACFGNGMRLYPVRRFLFRGLYEDLGFLFQNSKRAEKQRIILIPDKMV